MLNDSLFEHYSPIGVVMPHRGIDIETARELGVNLDNIIAPFELFSKGAFSIPTINDNKVIQRLFGLNGIDSQFATKSIFSKYIAVKPFFELMVFNVLDNGKGFNLVNDIAYLYDKLFGVEPELVECGRLFLQM